MRETNAQAALIPEALYEKAIGKQVLDYLKAYVPQQMVEQVNTQAVLLLEKIRDILEDSSLNDPECFLRIDAMVDAFGEAGIVLARHDW